MIEMLVDVLFAAAVLMIIAGVVLKRREKSAAAGAKPVSRYLLIGGPLLLVVAVVLVVLDPDSMAQFTGAFSEGEKAGKAAAIKALTKPAAKHAVAAKQPPAPEKAPADTAKADNAKADLEKAEAASAAIADRCRPEEMPGSGEQPGNHQVRRTIVIFPSVLG